MRKSELSDKLWKRNPKIEKENYAIAAIKYTLKSNSGVALHEFYG